MYRLCPLLAPVFLTAVWLPTARAQQVLEVGINGFTCSMCAYGTEAALTDLPFVDSVQMDMEATTARVYVRPAQADWQAVAEAIVDAGFSVRSFAVLGKFQVDEAPGQLTDVSVGTNIVRLVRNPDGTQLAERLILIDPAFLPAKEAKAWKKDIQAADKKLGAPQEVYHAVLP